MLPMKFKEQIAKDIMDRYKTDLKKEEGNFSHDLVLPTAEELERMYFYLETFNSRVWVTETSGIYLDYAAESLGIMPRKQGSFAEVVLSISGKERRTIPKGTRFATESSLIFQTINDVTLSPEGDGKVIAKAEKIGVEYNAEAASIQRLFQTNSNINSVTNEVPAKGGTDIESDKALFDRIDFARKQPATSGNKYDYMKWAREVDGVGFVKVFPCHDGPNTVKVLIADENRKPVDEVVRQTCEDHINDVRTICSEPTVVSAVSKEITVKAKIEITAGANLENIKEKFVSRMESYFSEMALWNDKVLHHRVGAILIKTEEVEEYNELLLNGMESDIELSEEEVPVIGEVILE